MLIIKLLFTLWRINLAFRFHKLLDLSIASFRDRGRHSKWGIRRGAKKTVLFKLGFGKSITPKICMISLLFIMDFLFITTFFSFVSFSFIIIHIFYFRLFSSFGSNKVIVFFIRGELLSRITDLLKLSLPNYYRFEDSYRALIKIASFFIEKLYESTTNSNYDGEFAMVARVTILLIEIQFLKWKTKKWKQEKIL